MRYWRMLMSYMTGHANAKAAGLSFSSIYEPDYGMFFIRVGIPFSYASLVRSLARNNR